MPVEFWKSGKGKAWYWTAFGTNGEVVADSAESYTTKANATKGATAAAKELVSWLDGKKAKTTKPKAKPSSRKKMTSEPRKRAGKGSTSSSSRTRKTGQRAG